jgi:hypothetical protein
MVRYAAGFGWPGGRGLHTSKGSLKSRPVRRTRRPLYMGCGSVLLGWLGRISSGMEVSFFFSWAVRPLKTSAGASWPA